MSLKEHVSEYCAGRAQGGTELVFMKEVKIETTEAMPRFSNVTVTGG